MSKWTMAIHRLGLSSYSSLITTLQHCFLTARGFNCNEDLKNNLTGGFFVAFKPIFCTGDRTKPFARRLERQIGSEMLFWKRLHSRYIGGENHSSTSHLAHFGGPAHCEARSNSQMLQLHLNYLKLSEAISMY